MRRDAIVIRPYDPSWPAAFEHERQRLAVVLQQVLRQDIEHMGSTAVPELPAKPIIDMLAVVDDVDDAREAIQPMQEIGWIHAPEPADEHDRQLSFCTPNVEYRTHHLHVVEERSERWRGWLAFRDYLRTHPDVASAYAGLKRELADQHGQDPNQRDAYRIGKADFIVRVTQVAVGELEIDVATEIRRLADEIRAVADGGLRYADDLPYDAARYRHFRHIAAELMALVDERGADQIEQEVFSALSHLAPIPVVSAAVFDDANRILLVQRSDNSQWEMPGGALDPGESPAEGVQREAAEEAGVLVTPIELITVLDTRLEHSSPLQMVHIEFLCRYEGDLPGGPTTPYEVTAVEWFRPDTLPELRTHHARRVAQAFAFQSTPVSERRTSFDRAPSMQHDLAAEPWRRGVVLTDPRPRSIRDALHEVARTVPGHLAVDDGNRAISYADLVAETERVAAVVRAHPTDPASPVMVVVEQGTDAIVAIIGVTVSGRIAVTVDSRDPIERLREIHREAGAALIVCDRASVDVARAVSVDTPVITPDDLPATAKSDSFELDPASPATLYFTSGSTGTPKGLLRDHNSAVQGAFRYAYVEQLTPDDRYGLAGSVAFPAFQWFVWAALLNGISLHFYDLRSRGAAAIPDWINANGVTLTWFVPSVLRAVVHAKPDAFMPTIRGVGTGGEALLGSDVRNARALFAPQTVFTNWFASSEALTVCHWLVTPDDEASDGVVPIGPPQPWVDVRIVDDFDNDVDEGDPGTLMVIGEVFSVGYWRDPARTAAHFLDLPDGRRGCRTSDRVRRRSDGVLEHLGRSDDRAKVRGAMVSPSEVERALTALHEVAEAAVVATPDARTGGTRLIGYAVTEGRATPSGWQLRRELAARVPPHMVPGTIVILPTMPVGNRGKVDRAALPPPPDVPNRPYREPVGRERELADVFAQVLGVDKVGLDDDFFDLGGDSLAAIELLAAIDEHFGVPVTAAVLLESPTVAELGRRLVRRREHDASTVIALRAEGTGTPLFCVAGGGSPATSLRALADTLGPRPVYGIQARGLEERAWPDRSVEACARRYVRDVRSVEPTGPYLLAGHSFGGLVAFEMACLLEADGDEVTHLTIIDTVAPGAAMLVPAPSSARPSTRPRSSLAGAFRRVARSVAGHAQYRFELASAGLVRRRLRQYRVFYLLSQHIRARYRPKKRFHGSMLVAGSTAGADLPSLFGADLGWKRFVEGTVEAVEIASDHVGIMRQPHVRDLGDHIARTLMPPSSPRARGGAAPDTS